LLYSRALDKREGKIVRESGNDNFEEFDLDLNGNDFFSSDGDDIDSDGSEFLGSNSDKNDEFNQRNDVQPEDLDPEFSKDETTIFGGSKESLTNITTEDREQYHEIQEGIKTPLENIIDPEQIECKREKTEIEIVQDEKAHTMTIEGIKFAKEVIDEAIQTEKNTGLEAEKLREYTNEAEYFKGSFAKPKENEEDKTKKFIIMAAMSFAIGIFGGIQSNRYYTTKEGKVENIFNCTWSWLFSIDDMPLKILPFHSGAFFTGFFVWFIILAIICLFIWINNDVMKNSRVGHEHGNAKLMDKNSFQKFKNRFMEQ